MFTLSSADRPYRMFVENMRDGAATVSESGIVLYANRRLAELLACPLRQLIGSPVASLIADGRPRGAAGDRRARTGGTIEVELVDSRGTGGPGPDQHARRSTSTHKRLLCLTFADLTQQNAQKLEIDRLGQAQAERMRELEQAQAALTEQATHDALTGLPNRNLLIDRLAQALALAERSKTSTGLIFVDLDDFKEINDTRGHAAGDSVLRQVAQRLLNAVRPMDSVVPARRRRVRRAAAGCGQPPRTRSPSRSASPRRSTRRSRSSQGAMPVTASIGISVSDAGRARRELDRRPPAPAGRHRDVPRQVARRSADRAVRPGSTPTASSRPTARLWIARIHEALDEDRFVLHAQPIVDLATGADRPTRAAAAPARPRRRS